MAVERESIDNYYWFSRTDKKTLEIIYNFWTNIKKKKKLKWNEMKLGQMFKYDLAHNILQCFIFRFKNIYLYNIFSKSVPSVNLNKNV